MKHFTEHPKVCNFLQFNLLSISISNQKTVITSYLHITSKFHSTKDNLSSIRTESTYQLSFTYKTTCCIVYQKPQDTAMSKFNFTQLMKSVPFQLENVSRRRKSTAQQYTRYHTQTTDNTIRAENLIHLI